MARSRGFLVVRASLAAGAAACAIGLASAASAASPHRTPYLAGIHKHSLLASSIPANGDENPYSLVVAPATVGAIRRGDVLFDNFSNRKNLQGTRIRNGVMLTVTTGDAKQVAMIRGLGFAGILASGDFHPRHHLEVARGEPMH